MRKRILFAVGGTGGHLFPAQALARDLNARYEILFGGGKLSTNPFFEKELFSYREIKGSSPFRGNPLKAALELSKGVGESLSLLKKFSPHLVIGFGSFYSFPLLTAARIKKVPYLLVESNVLPGKVNRLFSSKAHLTAIQFEEASSYLKGKPVLTKMPLWAKSGDGSSREEAKTYFGLHPQRFTILVMGGSQGAEAINQAALNLSLSIPYQVIHLCGKDQDYQKKYKERGIEATVKPFENAMHMAWKAADLAICRSGAGTLTEILAFAVPAILIPWPKASENHQFKNACSFSRCGGVRVLKEEEIGYLREEIEDVLANLAEMKEKLIRIHRSNPPEDLSFFVREQLEAMT